MGQSWRDRWDEVNDLRAGRGAQARSYIVRSKENPDVLGFVKEVESRSPKDRSRFVREVTIYKTLIDAGLPHLHEDNAHEAGDRRTPLYLVIEYIPGGTLQDFVRDRGPVSYDEAVRFVERVAPVLHTLHSEEMAHRDLKPANIVLRDGDLGQPVIVDFGLSFIDDAADLTATNETVGNRFLSLPELTHGGRSPASDITQLTGIVFHLLTGAYPLSLDDGNGNKPHQTAEGRAALQKSLGGDQLRRLMSLFDRGFRPVVTDRFANVHELLDELHAVLEPPAEAVGYEAMREAIRADWVAAGGDRHDRVAASLAQARQRLADVMLHLGNTNGLETSQRSADLRVEADPPRLTSDYALARAGVTDRVFRSYSFELRGEDDWVLLVDGAERWRGRDLTDDDLFEALATAALEPLLPKP